MRTRFLVVALTSVAMLAAPAAGQDVGIKNPQQSTLTTLYFHMINVQDMPINTQIPNDEFTDVGGFSVGTNSYGCLHQYTGDATQGTTSQEYHTMYGYSSPSYVEYDFLNAQGDPRTHPERGISYDADLDQAAPFTIKWYFVAYATGSGPTEQGPIPTTNMRVAAIMRAGDAISIDDAGYDGGPILAQGRTSPALLLPGSPEGAYKMDNPSTAHPEIKYMGVNGAGQHVYEATITMAYEADKIQRATGYNMRIDMFVDNPHCDDPYETGPDGEKKYLMTATVVPYTDAENRPRMELSVLNPIRLEYLHPQFVGDDLVVHTSMNSVWGNYDVDEKSPDGIVVEITGPSTATSLAKAALVQRTHEHYHHQEAVDVTYVWPYKADRAANGLYTVFVSFKNDQGTAQATGTAQFEIGKGTVIGCGGVQEASQKLNDDCAKTTQEDGKAKAEESPGLPLLAALAALGAVAAAVRRRKA